MAAASGTVSAEAGSKAWPGAPAIHVVYTCCLDHLGLNFELQMAHSCDICLVAFFDRLFTHHCGARPTQPSIPPGPVNEDHLQFGRQRQILFIPFMD